MMFDPLHHHKQRYAPNLNNIQRSVPSIATDLELQQHEKTLICCNIDRNLPRDLESMPVGDDDTVSFDIDDDDLLQIFTHFNAQMSQFQQISSYLTQLHTVTVDRLDLNSMVC